MKFNYRTQVKFLLGMALLLFLIPKDSIGQNCPSFRISEIKNVDETTEEGVAVVRINGSKLYSAENFEVRQKENQVTGPIGYDIKMDITRDELIVSRLKKSEELYLKEYVILFSDKSCKNSAIVEVGTFKIK